MADLTRGYNVPGVYVRDETGPLVASAALPDAVVTLVGPALGYQVATDAVVISATATALVHRGVWYSSTGAPSGVVAPVVRNAAGTALTVDVDYVFADVFDDGTTQASNRVTTIVLGTPDNTGKTAGGVASGDTLTVTYYYTNAAYFTPLLFDSYDQVVATYGEALRITPITAPGQAQIVSPLSLAAALAFQNAATSLICVATDPTPVVPTGGGAAVAPSFAAQLRAAYAKTLGDYRVGVVVPILADGGNGALASLTEYGTNLRDHVRDSSADGYQRIGILGGQANQVGTDVNVPPPYAEVAEAIKSSRVILAYPNRLGYYNPATNRPIEVDGFYLAAGLAGILESNPVNQSLTREQVLGFTGLPASITRLNTKPFKDNLSSRGVCVAEVDRQNRLVVRHGLSTDTTSVLTREVSITRARDVLFEALQIGLDNSGLIGSPIDLETTTRVKGAVTGILEGLVQDETIIGYTTLQVRQQSISAGGSPDVIEVRFAYQPAVPLNYIVVTFSLDLTTGNVDVGDAQSSLPSAVTNGL